jgi:hypothetical protein
MELCSHPRIGRIKKTSRYLERILSWSGRLLWLGWPLLLAYAFAGRQWMLLAPGAVWIVLLQAANRFARQLMERFSQGDIFSARTVAIARKAVRYGIAIKVLGLAIRYAAVVATIGSQPADAWDDVPFDIVDAMLVIGAACLMLWTLEIGSDLHEESALTI